MCLMCLDTRPKSCVDEQQLSGMLLMPQDPCNPVQAVVCTLRVWKSQDFANGTGSTTCFLPQHWHHLTLNTTKCTWNRRLTHVCLFPWPTCHTQEWHDGTPTSRRLCIAASAAAVASAVSGLLFTVAELSLCEQNQFRLAPRDLRGHTAHDKTLCTCLTFHFIRTAIGHTAA